MSNTIQWVEFEVVLGVDTAKYRTTPDGKRQQFWAERPVSGFCRQGWNDTRSSTVAILSRNFLKEQRHE